MRIALIGDRDDTVVAHQAIARALPLTAQSLDVDVEATWLGTEQITSDADLAGFDGYWCVPASPYRNTDGALRAIAFARTQRRPYLGTCGGFQYAMIEFARNVLGWADADHAETASDPAARIVIAPLSCSLVEVRADVHVLPDSRLSRAYASDRINEGYHCNYGMAPAFRAALTGGPLRITAEDAHGDPRAVELEGHPFFVATLFQPERAALEGRVPPVVRAFVEAAQRLAKAEA